MKQVFFVRPVGGTVATDYTNPFNQAGWHGFGSPEDVRVPMPAAGTLRNLGIHLATAPGAGTSRTFTIRKNQAGTGLTLTIADTNTDGQSTGVDISVVAGDLIDLQETTSGSPANGIVSVSLEWEAVTARQSIYPNSTNGWAANWYGAIFRGIATPVNAASFEIRDLVAIPGLLTGYRFRLAEAPGVGNAITFAVWLNGVVQDGSGGTVDTRITISDTAQTGSVLFVLPLVAGDELLLKCTAMDYSPANGFITYASTFIADIDGYSQYAGKHSTAMDVSSATFSMANTSGAGNEGWDSAEADVEAYNGPSSFVLDHLIVRVAGAPGAAKSYTFEGRVANATPGGTPTVTISDSEVDDSDAVGSMSIAAGNTFALRATPAGTPASVSAIWNFGMFVAEPVTRVTQLVALLVQDRNPAPAVTPSPTGGGTVAAGVDPAPGIDLCPVEVPVAFMDITPPGLSTRRYSAVPINVTVADDPRVKSFGSITRALVDSGDIRGSSASAELIDTDRFLRGLESTDGLPNSVIEYYISSEAGIKAGATPRRVFSGLITDSEPLPELAFRVQATDYLQAHLDKSPQPTYPQRVFSVADFPNLANDPKSITSPGNPSLIGKPIPIGYGQLSDEANGLLAKGVVPAFFVGKRNVAGFDWDEYVVFGHAPAPGGVLGFFGDVFGGVSRDRFDPTFEGVDFLWPGHAGWNAALGSTNLYRDFNGNRYTVIYARGPRSDSAREGRIPFSINIGGIEDVGDGTGNVIESLPLQILHLLINFVLQNYTSGAWLAPPLVNGYSRVKTSSFVTVKTRSEVRTANGWLGAFLLGWDLSTVTLKDIARLAFEHGIQLGTNKDGQIIGTALDPAAASVRSVTDITDTIEQSFQARRQRADIRSRILYRYERRYVPALPEPTPVTGDALPNELRESHVDWEVDNQVQTDAPSIAKYGTRTMDLSFELTRDPATADDLALKHLEELAPGPVLSRYREGLCGTNIDLGDNHDLTHFEGITSAGWTAQLLRCERHRLDLDKFEVEIESMDIAGFVGSP